MSENNIITKPKRTYKKRVPKTTTVATTPDGTATITADVVHPTTPDVTATVTADVTTTDVTTTDVTTTDVTTTDVTTTDVTTTDVTTTVTADVVHANATTPDVTATVTADVVHANATTPDVTADVVHATVTATVTSDATATDVVDATPDGTAKNKKLTAKYEKFILYGLYLINSIQSSETPLNDSNSFDIAHVFDEISSQYRFIDSFLHQFKDIKSSYKNELKSRKNKNKNKKQKLKQKLNLNTDDSLVSNIVNASNNNSLSVQIIEIENIKYFITTDNQLLDFHTQQFIRTFIH